MPEITVSYAQSIDGRIATSTGDSKWISGRASLELAHRLREDNDAILVGIGTVLADDPELSCRLPGHKNDPVRVILDSSLRIPLDSKIILTASRYRTLIFCSAGLPGAEHHPIRSSGIEIVGLESDADGSLDVTQAARALFRMGCRTLFVEGGSRVITSFLRAGIVSRMVVVTAPVIIGKGIEAIGDLGVIRLSEALRPVSSTSRVLDGESVWELKFDVSGTAGSRRGTEHG